MAQGKPGKGIELMPSGRYRVRWTDQMGRRHARGGFTQMADARAFQRKVLANKGQEPPPAAPLWAKVLRRQLDDYAEIELGEFNPNGFFVYLLWPAAMDKPLYVGQSINVLARIGAHMANPQRRHLVDRVSFVKCFDETTMLETEERLIRFYEPEWNVLGPGRRKVWRLNGHNFESETDSDTPMVPDQGKQVI